jgi:hypothetical protein
VRRSDTLVSVPSCRRPRKQEHFACTVRGQQYSNPLSPFEPEKITSTCRTAAYDIAAFSVLPPAEAENLVQLTKCYKKNTKLSTTARLDISWHQTVLKILACFSSLIPSSRFMNFSTFCVHLFAYSAEPLDELKISRNNRAVMLITKLVEEMK